MAAVPMTVMPTAMAMPMAWMSVPSMSMSGMAVTAMTMTAVTAMTMTAVAGEGFRRQHQGANNS
jgi:hypothetical protein